jgi:hypothetical protein
MKSREAAADLLFLERDLPLTAEDIKALRENRPGAITDWWDVLTRVSEQVPDAAAILARRPTFAGYEPFEL